MVFNPTVAGGGLTWSDLTNYSVQQGLADIAGNPSATTVTGGTTLAGGYGVGVSSIETLIDNSLLLGSTISGTPDRIVLCVRPLTVNADVTGGINFKQLS